MVEPAMEPTPCLLCGADAYTVVHTGPDYLLRRPGAYRLVRCRRCGLIYQNPRPPLAAMSRFYPDSYGAYGSAAGGLRARRGALGALIRHGQGRRAWMLDRAVPPTPGRARRVLDVGCASGLFLEAMQARGWAVAGVEPNAAAARATSARLAAPVFAGPLEHARFPAASFDAVTLWDVLEHFHDPLVNLRALRRILRPGGAIFVRVPNADSYVARLAGRYWVGYDQPRHMAVFTPETLLRMLQEAGFGAPRALFFSASYLAASHSLRFALDDRAGPRLAAAVHRALYSPAARAVAGLPFRLADRVWGGAAVEVLALACHGDGMIGREQSDA
jgi:2-polyprenyl-3-methyl-5-hydroxy-6-metoxy-1,4-benzoquinol methylase